MLLVYGDNPDTIVDNAIVAIDIETTGLDWEDEIVGISLAWRCFGTDELQSCYLLPDRRGPMQQPELFSTPGLYISDNLLSRVLIHCEIVFHYIAFDMRMLWKMYKVPVPYRAHDTMVLAKSIEWQDELNLEYLYRRYVGEPPAWWVEMKNLRGKLASMAMEDQSRYGAFDGEATLLVFEKLIEKVRKGGTGLSKKIYARDQEFTRLVLQLICRGVPVNQEECQHRIEDFRSRMLEIAINLKTSGIANPGSNVQVGKALLGLPAMHNRKLPLTPGGVPKVSEEVLVEFQDIPEVMQIIKYRQLTKGIGSWLSELLRLSNGDGKVHAILSPFGTRSFRMSSENINLQGIPMKDKTGRLGKRAFGSFVGIFKSEEPGEELWQFDIKQAEFRLAAMLAKENNIARIFADGSDPYVQMAMVSWSDGNRREDAKRAALASLYETGVDSFAAENRISRGKAKEVLDGFRAAFPGIKNCSRLCERLANERGYIELMSGRRRYFGLYDELYKAFNQRVQGTVAEIMQTVMLEIERLYPGRCILQIHDSLVMYLPAHAGYRSEIKSRMDQVLSESVPGWLYASTDPSIPMLADLEIWQ